MIMYLRKKNKILTYLNEELKDKRNILKESLQKDKGSKINQEFYAKAVTEIKNHKT